MKKVVIILLLALWASLPSQAVLQEKNLKQSLAVLRVELQQSYLKQQQLMAGLKKMSKTQHEKMLFYMKKSNQIGLMLYSQQRDYVFDLTYACNEATALYRQFGEKRLPYYKINNNLDAEIARYDGLIYSLEILPPPMIDPMGMGHKAGKPFRPRPGGKNEKAPFELDSTSLHDRAMCLSYARALRGNCVKLRHTLRQDSMAYVRMNYNLSLLDKYAKKRYGVIQQEIFQDTGDNYFKVLEHLGRYWQQAKEAIDNKYSYHGSYGKVRSEWRGPIVMGYVSFVVFYLLVAVVFSFLFVNVSYRNAKRLKWIKSAPDEAERDRRWKKLHMLKPFVGISLGALIFALSVQTVKAFLTHNFFVMASGLLVEYAWLLTAITLSLLVRLRYNQMRYGYAIYLPMVLLGLVIIIFRIIFIPNNVVNLVFPPVALLFSIWQLFALKRNSGKLPESEVLDEATTPAQPQDDEDDADQKAIDDQLDSIEKEQEKAGRRSAAQLARNATLASGINNDTVVASGIAAVFKKLKRPVVHSRVSLSSVDKIPQYDHLYAWASLGVILVATLLTWSGRTLMSVEMVIWWLFQLTAIQALTLAFRLLDIYEKARLYDRLRDSGITDAQIAAGVRKGDYITRTWFFDFVHKALVPIAGAYSLLLSIKMAADVFNLGDTCVSIFLYPFLNVEGVVRLSIFSIVVVVAAWFLFRYLNYAIQAIYRHLRIKYQKKKTGKSTVRANEVNLTLGYNVIAILVWGAYAIFALILLRIPKSGISIVTAGLATGIGFAMKDLLNNFFYGISLMAGRLRVGDWIECDGVQGRVDSISYQSVQIVTTDDCLMSFLNSTLFAKNFRNLTRNNSYELIKIPVGVAYGVDVEHVRELLQSNILKLQRNDKYGRPVMDLKNHKILVLFDSFGDNSVNLIVAVWTLVVEKIVLMGQIKEAIYNTLNDNHIEIPFPQRDLYIKTLPQQLSPALDNDTKQ